MIGSLRLIARVSAGSQNAESTVDVAVTLRQTLRLAGVMISYNGPASNAPGAPNLTLAAPTLADLQAMAGTALTLFPVESTAAFRTAGTLVQTNHLQDTTFPTSGCGTEWDALHGRVANARTADGNQPGWIYYGLLPAMTPMGPVGGCGGGGVAVGPINQPGTLAHEAGHACGLEHAPAGGAPEPRPVVPGVRAVRPGQHSAGVDRRVRAERQQRQHRVTADVPRLHVVRRPVLDLAVPLRPVVEQRPAHPDYRRVDDPWWKDLVWEEIRKWPPIPEPDPRRLTWSCRCFRHPVSRT